MIPAQSLHRPAPVSAGAVVVPGIAQANRRARTLERRIALVVVILPVVGLVAAIVQLWGRAVGPVDLALLAGMYFVTSIGIGIGYHRLVAHGSFQTVGPIRALLAVFGSMAAQGPILYWAAIHRRHHSCSDQPGDPHSPHVGQGAGLGGLLRGFWHAHVGWLFAHEITDWSRYGIDLLRDRTLFVINRLYFLWVVLGLALPAAVGGALTRSWHGALTGLVWGGLVRIFLVHHVTWGVNSICHIYGTTPFRSRDESRNNAWLALPSFGEAWHNNHHAFPFSAVHGLRWWQVDLNAGMIRGLEALGLAWNVKVPTPKMLREARIAPPTGAPGGEPAGDRRRPPSPPGA
jgi:stearoyl-CoA desaturase (Delta-9 desaturase)